MLMWEIARGAGGTSPHVPDNAPHDLQYLREQVDALQARNIAAFYTNSSQSQREFNSILDIVRQGRLKLLYIAPERLKNAEVLAVLRERPPSAIFVDEAHCVSQWGHTFRPWYGQLGKIFARLPFRVQICAFTATATPLVQGDIIRVLGRPDMQVGSLQGFCADGGDLFGRSLQSHQGIGYHSSRFWGWGNTQKACCRRLWDGLEGYQALMVAGTG